jgi:hypothetical protein
LTINTETLLEANTMTIFFGDQALIERERAILAALDSRVMAEMIEAKEAIAELRQERECLRRRIKQQPLDERRSSESELEYVEGEFDRQVGRLFTREFYAGCLFGEHWHAALRMLQQRSR